jgi:hypothetical protein
MEHSVVHPTIRLPEAAALKTNAEASLAITLPAGTYAAAVYSCLLLEEETPHRIGGGGGVAGILPQRGHISQLCGELKRAGANERLAGSERYA